MVKRVRYQRQKRMYMLVNPRGYTVLLFPNLKAAVAYLNSLDQVRLEGGIDYQNVVYRIGSYGSFSLDLGGSEFSLKVIAVEGVFVNSKKSGVAEGSRSSFVQPSPDLSPIRIGDRACRFNEVLRNWTKYQGGAEVGVCASRFLAAKWCSVSSQ